MLTLVTAHPCAYSVFSFIFPVVVPLHKLVHAQLRECLEDTQVKLEHKSQSAARRLLNSAARLAYEFAKPDRSSTNTGGSKKAFSRTMPKAMGRQGSDTEKTPLTRNGGRRFGRSKSPPPPSEEHRPAEKTDLSATL